MKAFSGDVKNKDCVNPSCAFIDEYHAHPTSKLFDVMSSAQGQRAQSLIFTITTAGDDVESPCHKEYEYCKLIIEGSVSSEADTTKNENYFVMIAGWTRVMMCMILVTGSRRTRCERPHQRDLRD